MGSELEVRTTDDRAEVMAGVMSGAEVGEYEIPDEALVRADAATLEAWGHEVMAEARRRGLRLNIEHLPMRCVTVVRWRPDRPVGEVRSSGWSA
jgi:hypothetical protein